MLNPFKKVTGITANVERGKRNKKKDDKSAIERTEAHKID